MSKILNVHSMAATYGMILDFSVFTEIVVLLICGSNRMQQSLLHHTEAYSNPRES